MFSGKRNKKIANEKIIYEAKPNMIIGCKKAIWGVIILIFLIWVSNPIKLFLANMQIYAISYIKFGITGYAMLAIVLLILIDLMYIIWQLLSWYSISYTITNHRIISKKGFLNTKKTYMPFKSIQDIDLSQNILEKIFNVGTVTAYSAYDNNNMRLANISNPSKVEDILFDKINESIPEDYDRGYIEEDYHYRNKPQNRGYRKAPRRSFNSYSESYEEDYFPESERYGGYSNQPSQDEYFDESYENNYDEYYYDEKPLKRNKRSYNQYDYEEYPEYDYRNKGYQKYDYEFYEDNLEDNLNYAINDMDRGYKSKNDYRDSEPYYNDEDYDSMEEFYQNNKEEIKPYMEEKTRRTQETSENIVQRHFDKFNR
ncbi:MAG: PH domain-containing protein [Methanobrevibacter sp.]|uniref:PH domain-containing protein n=1 Tax=Methanobrevibacter sp. TaxID=66852 RepID=UPI0026DEEFD1|nr:PH domain-containing protein [Methanobrevibacter sp.]MDO5848373.1 PH domain-containing protein [Methanobrevibacter sp.]